jgi:hypothetical protein
MAGRCGPVNCCRSFSRILGAPHPGYSRFKRTIVASRGAGNRFLPVRAVAPIAEGLDPAVFVAVEDLVAGLARIPNSAHSGAIFSPSSRRATNRSRSSMT